MSADPTRIDVEMLGATRRRVLDELQTENAPLGVATLAERLTLHPNTLRFHLGALIDAGLAERQLETSHRAGRPAVLYTATADSPIAGQRSYQLLAQILTRQIATHNVDASATALEAGRDWGRSLARRPSTVQPADAAEATRQLKGVLTEAGFQPRIINRGARRRVELHHCPFRELAATHGNIVCSIHLGVMQGLLTELDAPIHAASAEPFVETSLCLVHLESRPPDRRRAAPIV